MPFFAILMMWDIGSNGLVQTVVSMLCPTPSGSEGATLLGPASLRGVCRFPPAGEAAHHSEDGLGETEETLVLPAQPR